jgi:hypothetical protein
VTAHVAPPTAARVRDGHDSALRILNAAIVVAAGVAYGVTAPAWVLGGDNGELASLFAAGGIAHPPGFPTMVLWLRLWHWLPVATPALGAALVTALTGMASVLLLQRACLAWGVSAGASALVSAVFAFSPETWKQSSHAEVFALNAMFAGALLTLAAPPASEPNGARRIALLGVIAGLAIDNHQTIVLLAPLYAAVAAVRASKRRAATALVGIVALVVAVVAPYIYVYVRARANDVASQPLWIEAPTVEGVFFHFRRGAYGTLSLASESEAVARAPLTYLRQYLEASCVHLLGLPLVALAGVVAFARDLRRGRDVDALAHPRGRGAAVALVASFVLAGPAFVAVMNIPLAGVGSAVAERFFLLPGLVLCLLAGLSLDRLVPWFRSRSALVLPLTATVATIAACLALPAVREESRPDVAQYLDNVLATVPAGSIIVATGDQTWGAFTYARYAEHERADVAVVVPGLIKQAWYRRQTAMTTRVNFETPEGKPIGAKTLLGRLLATGRPVFYTDWPDAKLQATAHDSYGPLMRVWPESAPRPTLDALLQANIEAFATYTINPSPPGPATWGHSLYESYARAWVELGRRLEAEGRQPEAQACLARAFALAPWSLVRTALP